MNGLFATLSTSAMFWFASCCQVLLIIKSHLVLDWCSKIYLCPGCFLATPYIFNTEITTCLQKSRFIFSVLKPSIDYLCIQTTCKEWPPPFLWPYSHAVRWYLLMKQNNTPHMFIITYTEFGTFIWIYLFAIRSYLHADCIDLQLSCPSIWWQIHFQRILHTNSHAYPCSWDF